MVYVHSPKAATPASVDRTANRNSSEGKLEIFPRKLKKGHLNSSANLTVTASWARNVTFDLLDTNDNRFTLALKTKSGKSLSRAHDIENARTIYRGSRPGPDCRKLLAFEETLELIIRRRMPSVVIVIPTLLGGATFSSCLQALCRQSFRAFAAIFVNNGAGLTRAERQFVEFPLCVLSPGANIGFGAVVSPAIADLLRERAVCSKRSGIP